MMMELLKLFAGTWSGTGLGEYPTIEPFEYTETLRFQPDEARPLLHYEQRTYRRNFGQTEYISSHWESGFLRALSETQVELSNAQSGGRLELMTGTLVPTATGLKLKLRSVHLVNDPRMQETERELIINGGQLRYVMNMRTTRVPNLVIHVEAQLARQ